MTTVDAFAAKLDVLIVATGVTVATSTAAPLASPFVVMQTVNEVAVAAVTFPTAPPLKVTKLLPGVGSKPKPLMMISVSSAARSVVLIVNTGTTVATLIIAPLLTPLVTTSTVRSPAVEGGVPNVTVREFDVDAVTVPTAPLLNVTALLPNVVSNPETKKATCFARTMGS